MKTTWILIANASEARLFKTERINQAMQLIDEFSHPESREKINVLVSDVQGRYRKSKATPKSAYEEPTSPKEVEADTFARELATKLDKGRTQNLYHYLILIAPPHFQGLLNKHCNSHVKQRVTNKLDKDYTKVKEHELGHYLNGKLSNKKAA